MGLLDDAIREHLELKRKHGAAEDDLRRQEAEALGPARRDFAVQEAVEAPPEPAAAPPPALEDEPVMWLDDEPEAPPEPLEHAAEAADPASAHEPLAAPDPAAPVREETPALEHDVPPPPPRVPVETVEEEPAAVERPPAAGEPPETFQPAPADEADEADEAVEDGEDVLEETPDFLQDTPEHDRLWFEQKPPRDFDFDA